ncbi:EARP and GARP complex-interacting protein 1 isoform X3 [Urocitellus parryii]|uniref:EARP-interacting protein isoform X1 n=1 Tax=Urocitellus parryii TaxID=9999 RepID=UPI000E55F370|nr:EARP-interacting protein isoform X1 [Urocitellus parryii]
MNSEDLMLSAPPTAESRHVRPCGGCPRSWSPEARSPPTTLQAPPRPWSCSVTWTTQPMAMWPASPGSRWEMGRRSSPWPTTTCCCGTCRRAPARLCAEDPTQCLTHARFPAISAAGHLVDVLLSCPASRLAKRPCFQPGLSPSGSLLHRPLLQGWLASLCPNLASSASLEGKGQLKFTSGRWSPHHNCTQVATASDTTLRGWDTRSMSQIYCIENAHGQLVRDLDFNPNKQYYLASCGDDCKVKFWDTRNVTEPVKTLEEHSHWVWSVRYNHSHDQLVLTGSSDSRVILSNMVSISSEPFGHLVDDDDVSDPEEHHADEKSKEPLQDNVIATYEEHEDSVYAVDWSSADPWLFASLSYDGRLVINRVPRALKYHILL